MQAGSGLCGYQELAARRHERFGHLDRVNLDFTRVVMITWCHGHVMEDSPFPPLPPWRQQGIISGLLCFYCIQSTR
jgi:hypothetical protein